MNRLPSYVHHSDCLPLQSVSLALRLFLCLISSARFHALGETRLCLSHFFIFSIWDRICNVSNKICIKEVEDVNRQGILWFFFSLSLSNTTLLLYKLLSKFLKKCSEIFKRFWNINRVRKIQKKWG